MYISRRPDCDARTGKCACRPKEPKNHQPLKHRFFSMCPNLWSRGKKFPTQNTK